MGIVVEYILPKALKYVLMVYRLIRMERFPRIEAIKKIALKERIDPQTVSSACTKSLGIKMADFDDFVLDRNTKSFEEYLIKRFPDYQDEIERFFDEIAGQQQETQEDDLIRRLKALFPEEKRDLLKSVLLNKIKEDFLGWISRKDIPDDVIEELKKWIDVISNI